MKKKHIDNFYKNILKESTEVCALTLPLTIIYKHMSNQGASILQSECDLTHSEMDVLATLLFNNKVMSPTDLYEATVFSSGGMTKILKKLQNKELISRKPSKEDKRSMLVQLEQKGEDLVKICMESLIKNNNDFFNVLDASEKEFLQQIFKKLLYSLFENSNK